LKALIIREDVVPRFHFPLLKTLHLNQIVFFLAILIIVEDLQITDLLLLGSGNEINGEFKRLSNLVKVNVLNFQRVYDSVSLQFS